VLENSSYKLYCDRSKAYRTTYNNRQDIVILNKTVKESHLIDVAIPGSHSLLHSTITERFQKYGDLKEELIRIRLLKTAHIMPPVLSATGIIPKQIKQNFKTS
jgi:hypothetical protein